MAVFISKKCRKNKTQILYVLKLQYIQNGFSLSIYTNRYNFEYRSLICWGLLPKPAKRIKRYPAHFIVEGEFIRRLIQDYRPFVARSSPQKVDIKIIKTCPNPRTHWGLLPPQLRTEIAQNTVTEQSQAKPNQTFISRSVLNKPAKLWYIYNWKMW